jgi:ABC-type transport system involved in multi-copper enzyme maturation permease subunit
MSTATGTTGTDLPPGALDVSGTRGIPFSRLVRVELRKLADTRAGRWLLAVIAVVTALIVVIVFINTDPPDRTFMSFIAATATPQGFVLPVLGILLVTSEWSQRTALVTFTLEPARGRVVAAKVVAALIAGIAAILLAMAVAALAATAGGAAHPWTHLGLDDLGKFALLQISGILQGLAFGLLLLSSAPAIVLYYVLPTAFSIVANVWGALSHAAPWVDLGTSQQPLFSGQHMSGEQWWHLASGSAIWIVLPFLLGLVRVLRAEVK